MYKKVYILASFIVCLLIAYVYSPWLTYKYLASGDWGFIVGGQAESLSDIFLIWIAEHNLGFYNGISHNINVLYELSIYLSYNVLGIDWNIGEKIFWFFPFFIVAVVSAYYLLYVLRVGVLYRLIGILIYLTNTYILMIVGGGQMGIAMAYAFIPGILGLWIKRSRLWGVIPFSLVSALQLMYDYRVFYITIVLLGIYSLVELILRNDRTSYSRSLIIDGAISLLLILLLNSYWIYPAAVIGSESITTINDSYTSSSSLDFFSFATLEKSISLLHPLWSDNIFGKVSLMKWEFLILPTIIFLGLLLFSRKKLRQQQKASFDAVITFSLVMLIGSFLAKGTKDPFDSIYVLLFDNIPGFILFRDPTKWYMLVAIGYIVVIPLVLQAVVFTIRDRVRYARIILVIIFAIFWIGITHHAWSRSLTGTFEPNNPSYEDIQLTNMLSSQPTFGRTLWIPMKNTFGYHSNAVPELSLSSFLLETDLGMIGKWISDDSAQEQLERWSISTVVIPHEESQLLFMSDYKYDEQKREMLIASVSAQPFLTRTINYSNHAVYTTDNHNDLFWIEGEGSIDSWKRVNATNYLVTMSAKQKDVLVFSQLFDKAWVAQVDSKNIYPNKTSDNLIEYVMPEDLSRAQIIVTYTSQKYAYIGVLVSAVSLVCVILFVVIKIVLHKKNKKK